MNDFSGVYEKIYTMKTLIFRLELCTTQSSLNLKQTRAKV
jgi:hypothetical protein